MISPYFRITHGLKCHQSISDFSRSIRTPATAKTSASAHSETGVVFFASAGRKMVNFLWFKVSEWIFFPCTNRDLFDVKYDLWRVHVKLMWFNRGMIMA